MSFKLSAEMDEQVQYVLTENFKVINEYVVQI